MHDPRGAAGWTRPACALVALAAFAVYAWLIPSASGMGDASELTLVLATGGVPHPTGYPLYVLAGHLFCLALHALGIGWSKAAALWSAAGAALALGFLLALAMRLASGAGKSGPGAGAATRFLAALVPLALFAFQPVLVAEATRAEVNSWSLAWACGAAYAFLRLVDSFAAGGADRGQLSPGIARAEHAPAHVNGRATPGGLAPRHAALWGLIVGLGLAHHLTSILVSLPLSAALVAMVIRRRSLTPRHALAALGAALVPVASYGIVAWHAWHPARVQWALLDPSVASVIAHITGAQYRHFLGYFDPSPPQRELLATVVYPFLFPGLFLLLLGLARARDPGRRLAGSALFVAVLLVSLFTFRYGVSDPAAYFLPAMALGVAAAAPALAALAGAARRAAVVLLGAAAAAAVLVIVPWLKDGLEEREATMDYERTIRSMWSAIPPDTAIVSWADDRYHRLIEYQILRGEKPALLIVTPDLFFANTIRREIIARFGADPLEGFTPPRVTPGAPDEKEVIARHRRALVENLNARVRVPVILFDPGEPIVFQLRKPWELAGAPAR